MRHLAGFITLLALGCGHATPGAVDAGPVDAGPLASTVVLFDLSASGALQHPWPWDLDRDDGGHPRFEGLPNPSHNSLLQTYVQLADGRFDGFPVTGAAYFRLSGDLDLSNLPATPLASLDVACPIAWVDVDAQSPERGRRVPLVWTYQGASTHFWPSNTLAVAPAPGFPLRPRTRYAVVVTTALRDAHGEAVGPDAVLRDLLSAAPPAGPAQALLGPVLDELARDGIPRARIASATTFTTQHIADELFRAVDLVAALPAPTVQDISKRTDGPSYFVYEGHFGPVPRFQVGQSPYSNPGEGDFVFDDAGNPQVQGNETLRFVLTVPRTSAPAGGFPVVIYAHGTGGDAFSFTQDGTASGLAAQGLAGLGFDQPFAGERAVGTNTQLQGLQFFNFFNPVSLQRNIETAALDMERLARLIPGLAVPASLSPMGPIALNGAQVVEFTHSQGSQGGALWLAASAHVRAAVLSGAGGTPLFALTQKTPRNDNLAALALVLGVDETDAVDLQPLAPMFTLARIFTDPASPENYARFFAQEPRPGLSARSVYVTMGLPDSYVTAAEIGALAVASKLPLVKPQQVDWPAYDALGVASVDLPLAGNLGGGTATGAWQQFTPTQGEDGHFVAFDEPGVPARIAAFLGAAARGPSPALAP